MGPDLSIQGHVGICGNTNKKTSGASQVLLVVKNLPANAGNIETWVYSWIGKIPWRRARQPTPVFLTGESIG